ncbi:CD302 antigen isoform X1 [Hyla sarda]|uniref:CD302 antigen isoform X1 n=1 Tax=Hyla sarda TaxID=327740 RepID=UPI0024C38023|nr:CD302 antigen isoform X1 [Hyla sarda]
MGRTLSYLTDGVSNGQTRRTLLICLCSAVCCVSSQGDVCPSPSWVQFESSCYIFLTEKNSLSIEPARHICKEFGADIISIRSKEENSFLVKMFKTKWKGPAEVLLGMFYDSDDNSLKWFDKSNVTFLNWGQGQPDHNDLDTCVKMNTQSGLWDVTDCDIFSESAVLCKYIAKEKHTYDKKAIKIALILIFVLITLGVPTIVLLLLNKKNWSNRLHRVHVPPYRDDAVLVDTLESEDYA